MSVFDASAVLDVLATRGVGAGAVNELLVAGTVHAPHVLPAEVVSAVRSRVRGGDLDEAAAGLVLEDLRVLPLELYPFLPFVDRVWELRHNLTPYDAWYAALAETLETDLVTSDERLLAAPGPRCVVRRPAS